MMDSYEVYMATFTLLFHKNLFQHPCLHRIVQTHLELTVHLIWLWPRVGREGDKPVWQYEASLIGPGAAHQIAGTSLRDQWWSLANCPPVSPSPGSQRPPRCQPRQCRQVSESDQHRRHGETERQCENFTHTLGTMINIFQHCFSPNRNIRLQTNEQGVRSL